MDISPLNNPLTIGIDSSIGDRDSQVIVKGVGTALQRHSATVLPPYFPASDHKADVVANIAIRPECKGSGWNFLITFPGFLIWTPAWHGYVYEVNYDVDITLTRCSDNRNIDSWSIPINLNLRHAGIDRTWTEIGWLEFGVIPFVGGLIFIQYDTDVTPILTEKIEAPIGEYIAQQIITRINSHGEFAHLVSDGQPENLTTMLNMTGGDKKNHKNNVDNKTVTSVATPSGNIKIISYSYEDKTQRGVLSVDVSGRGIEAREWVVANIGKICSGKNLTIEAGKEPVTGGRYRILNESIKNDILTIEFEASY